MREPHAVVTYGLTDEEHALVERSLPERCEAFATSAPSDLVVHGDVAAIVRATELDENSLEFLSGYYGEVGDELVETVAWIGEPAPNGPMPGPVKRFATFGELASELEGLLRGAGDRSRLLCSLPCEGSER
ncbi:MAG: hypothetical protein ACI36Y_08735 [Coriobacteriales bacterium]